MTDQPTLSPPHSEWGAVSPFTIPPPLTAAEQLEHKRIVAEVISCVGDLLADPAVQSIFARVGTAGDFSPAELAILDADQSFDRAWVHILSGKTINEPENDEVAFLRNVMRNVAFALARRISIGHFSSLSDQAVTAYVANRITLLPDPGKGLSYANRLDQQLITVDDWIGMIRELSVTPEFIASYDSWENFIPDLMGATIEEQLFALTDSVRPLARRIKAKYGYFGTRPDLTSLVFDSIRRISGFEQDSRLKSVLSNRLNLATWQVDVGELPS